MIQVEKHKVPSEYLQCDDLPLVPNVTMQSEVGIYLVKLYDVARECKGKLMRVRGEVDFDKE